MSKILTFKNVHFSFEAKKLAALGGVSFEILSDETLVLLGPSGTGKSTLVSLITGARSPQKGSIEAKVAPGDIGVFGQFSSAQMKSTLKTLLEAKLTSLTVEEAHNKIHTMIDLLGLQYKENRILSELSQGQLTRAMLAHALITEPKLLLLDEPLAHLDPVLKSETIVEYRELRAAFKFSALWITHDPGEALSVGDRLGYLDHGVLKQVGAPTDFVYHPKMLEIARFFGPLNVFVAKRVPETNLLDVGFDRFEVAAEILDTFAEQLVVGVRPASIFLDTEGALKGKIHLLCPIPGAVMAEIRGLHKNPIKIQLFRMPGQRHVHFRIKWSESLFFAL